jgi:predicted 2-oxoglutarate/Fe(II)-dependent dioxygenase YbiX
MDKIDYANDQKWLQDRPSITPSGFYGNSVNMIQARENFMTEEELEFLYSSASNLKEWDITETHYNEDGVVIYDNKYWDGRVASRPILDKQDPKISEVINNLVDRLKKEVDSFFNVNAVPTSPAIVRWPVGYEQQPHADKELHIGEHAGKPNDFPYYDLAGLFYLNDDYQGGELYFPHQELQFKPKRGAAYFFPGDKNFIHGVSPVTSGIRYVIPFFWTIAEHTGERKP